MKRRQFIALLSGAAVAPVFAPRIARAQQAMPMIGFLNSQSPDGYTERLREFHRGLKEAGYVEGDNVTIVYRWAENQMDRVPALAADLVRRQVKVIVAFGGMPVALTAKTATTTIPIVFNTSEDPVRGGLVTTLARPGGNLTGINFFTGELVAKRLELLRELVPGASRVAVLVNPAGPSSEITVKDAEAAARAMGLQIQFHTASTSGEINAVFATLARERPDAFFISSDPFFSARRAQLVGLAARHALAASYPSRDYPLYGGLMSYGSDLSDAWRHVGVYAGRILKGSKPADLPVVQASRFELVINAETARMLGLAMPPQLLARTDEVIE